MYKSRASHSYDQKAKEPAHAIMALALSELEQVYRLSIRT